MVHFHCFDCVVQGHLLVMEGVTADLEAKTKLRTTKREKYSRVKWNGTKLGLD